MILTRWCNPPAMDSSPGTFGTLTIGEHQFFTVECPWLDNAAFVSSIPEGTYSLVPHRGSWDTFAMVSALHGVALFSVPGCKRYACIIHPANSASELRGCIAVGDELGVVDNEWAVMHSQDSFRRLMLLIRARDERVLTIERA